MDHHALAASLLEEHGRTFASEAGITLRDKPAPLYQLLVLSVLSSAPIPAATATATARELFSSGWRTPTRMRAATWQAKVAALGRGGYRRYDESTATALGRGADWVLGEHRGDLRALRPRDRDGVAGLVERLQEAPRLGPVGAGIFCREVQAVWPEARPFFDRRGLARAGELGLPTDPDELASLVRPDDVARLSAALTRSALSS